VHGAVRFVTALRRSVSSLRVCSATLQDRLLLRNYQQLLFLIVASGDTLIVNFSLSIFNLLRQQHTTGGIDYAQNQ